jgi:hypothetical protein
MSLTKARFKSHLAIRVAQSWFDRVLKHGSIRWDAEHRCEYNDHTVEYNMKHRFEKKVCSSMQERSPSNVAISVG